MEGFMVFMAIAIVPIIIDSGPGQNVKPKMSIPGSPRLMGLWKTSTVDKLSEVHGLSSSPMGQNPPKLVIKFSHVDWCHTQTVSFGRNPGLRADGSPYQTWK